MGCYGIGPARIAAAAVEQFADEHGIAWPRAFAPFAVHLVAARQVRARPSETPPSAVRDAAARVGWRSSTTTATPAPGEKFADAELLGCPVRLTVGRRSLESGVVEAQLRRGRERLPGRADGASRSRAPAGAVDELCREAPADTCSDSDRSGPPPPQTQAGQPLRPWTLPNAIGFARLALIPVFLIVALSSTDGIGALPATLFAVIGWGTMPTASPRARPGSTAASAR